MNQQVGKECAACRENVQNILEYVLATDGAQENALIENVCKKKEDLITLIACPLSSLNWRGVDWQANLLYRVP